MNRLLIADRVPISEEVDLVHEHLVSEKLHGFYVGLFWFSDDYKEIVEVKGLKKFTNKDIELCKTVLPKGSHTSYKSKRFATPRGRVELNKGRPAISVGEKCPDKVLNLVIKFMGLNKYRDIIDVRRNPFWDKKGLIKE